MWKILGIKENSSETEIKKAYKKLAKKWHPDKNRTKGAEKKFQEISEAYQQLLNRPPQETEEEIIDLNPLTLLEKLINNFFADNRIEKVTQIADAS